VAWSWLQSAAVLAHVRAQFDRTETEAMTKEPTRFEPGGRPRESIVFEKILQSKSRIEGRSIFFVEATRHYRQLAPPGNPGCAPESVWQVWLSQDAAGAVTILSSEMTLTDCDAKGLLRLTPFAIVPLDGRWFVLGEALGYEIEKYVILEIEDRTVTGQAAVSAGGC